MDKTSELQIYGISREDFEKPGRSTQEEELIQTVMKLLQDLDATRAKVIHLDPHKLAMYTRLIEVAAQRVGLPVIVKTLSNAIATSFSRAVNVHKPVLEVTVHACPSRAWATLTTF